MALGTLGAAAIVGLVWGSFVGVLVDRVPRGESVVRGRSRCDACGRPLSVSDLVPMVSWLALRGRCRTCGAAISGRWTLIELGCAALALAGYEASDGDLAIGVGLAMFLGLLLGLTIIDLEHRRLPNAIVYPAASLAVVAILTSSALGGTLDAVAAVVGACSFGGSLLLVALVSRGGMGMGDVKLAALIGLVLGAIDLRSVGVAAGIAILLGGLAGLIALIRGADRRSALPFGPMLAAGAFVGVIAGRPLADAYLGLFR